VFQPVAAQRATRRRGDPLRVLYVRIFSEDNLRAEAPRYMRA
jgi:hypothetical protein